MGTSKRGWAAWTSVAVLLSSCSPASEGAADGRSGGGTPSAAGSPDAAGSSGAAGNSGAGGSAGAGGRDSDCTLGACDALGEPGVRVSSESCACEPLTTWRESCDGVPPGTPSDGGPDAEHVFHIVHSAYGDFESRCLDGGYSETPGCVVEWRIPPGQTTYYGQYTGEVAFGTRQCRSGCALGQCLGEDGQSGGTGGALLYPPTRYVPPRDGGGGNGGTTG